MGEISRWLMHEDRKELFEFLVGLVLNIFFLVLITLLLWPLGRLGLAWGLARGYGILWLITWWAAALVYRIQHVFRVNLYDHGNVYLFSNLFVSCFLQTGWSAFAALSIRGAVTGASTWTVVLVYLAGALSCLAAFYAVSAFYQGHFYRFVSLPLALVGFLVFSVWPASGRVLYGWFFRLF